MKRTRTRITFGSGGLYFLMAAALILSAAVYTQANLLFWGFGLMIGALTASLLYASVTLRDLEVERLAPSHGSAGDLIPLRYQLNNPGRFPVFSIVVEELDAEGAGLAGPPSGWLMHLGPRQALSVEAPCMPRRRGVVTFKQVKVTSAFPFGILRKSVYYEEAAEVRVVPELRRLRSGLLHKLTRNDPAGRIELERAGGTGDFHGLRPYRPGDPMRVIDWKRTAKIGEPVSRELTRRSPPQLVVHLDLRECDGRVEPGSEADALTERAISLAASLICEGEIAGCEVGLVVSGHGVDYCPPQRGIAQRVRVLELLSELSVQAHEGGASSVPVRPHMTVRPGLSGGGSGPGLLSARDYDTHLETQPTGDSLLRQAGGMQQRSARMRALSQRN